MHPRLLIPALLALLTAALISPGLMASAQTPTAPWPPAPPRSIEPDLCAPSSPIPACGPAEAPAPKPPVSGHPAPPLPMPLPSSAPQACAPGSPTAPCPQPEPPGGSPPGPAAPISESPQECGFSNIPACVSEAMAGFFKSIVAPGLKDALGFLGSTLLATPKLDQVPVMGEIWEHSRQIVLISYSLVVTIAGLVVLAYQTLQTRASIKEILPRVAIGFVAANLSMLLAGYAIDLANAFSQAILGSNLDPDQIGQSMTDTFMHDIDGGTIFLLLIALALLVMVVVVLLTYVVRIMITIVLLAAAPVLLMCHALPHTEPIAFWWWKAFAGTLAIQIGQSFALVAAVKLFFLPGGITLF